MSSSLNKKQPIWYGVLILSSGALLAALDGKGTWLAGWLGYSSLILLSALAFLAVWKQVKGNRKIGSLALTAYLLRAGLGIVFMLSLPALGYQDNLASQAGYLYRDAFVRDQQAWELAASGGSLLQAFSGVYSGDQYGGFLAFSAFIYRYLGFGVHRPWLVILITSAVSGLGVLWLWRAALDWLSNDENSTDYPREKLSPRFFIPIAAAWIYVIYPEAVFLGSAHMREPIVLAFIAFNFFSLTQMQKEPRKGWLGFIISALILFLFQLPVGVAVTFVSVGFILLEYRTQLHWKTWVIIAGILLTGTLLLIGNWMSLPSLGSAQPLTIFNEWLQHNFGFQSYLAERQSGMIQKLILGAGKQAMLPIILVYGFAQPVLPATIVDPAVWFWKIFNIVRSLGWYALAFLLIYNSVVTFTRKTYPKQAVRTWFTLAVLAWILISAANAGGDMWDNPRYRTMFLVYQALLAAWAIWWAQINKDKWFWRWLTVEGVFVLAFLEWYISRFYPALPHLSIWIMIALTLLACGVILVGGWVWDHIKKDNRAL